MNDVSVAAAVRVSLAVGCACTLLGAPVAIALGWLLARRRFVGHAALSAVILAPLVLPPVVTGFVLLRLFGAHSSLGGVLAACGMRVPFSFAGAVLAALVVGLPLHVAAARAAFESVDRRFEEVSLALGVPPWRTFVRVTLPLAAPGLLAGSLLAFARALGEFGATAVLAGSIEGRTRTIALAIYALLDVPDGGREARALVLCSVALAAGAIVGYEALVRWQRRRLDRDAA